MGNGFRKFSRTCWALVSTDGYLLTKGPLDPKMLPYHLDAMTDHMPALVTAPNKFKLHEIRKQWNAMIRFKGYGRAYYTRDLVHECKVRITIEEAT